jgi:DoxX-like family
MNALARNLDLFEALSRGFVAPSRGRTIAFWAATVWVLFDLLVGGVLDMVRIPPFHDLVVVHLGYAEYFLVIMGGAKVLAGVAVAIPRYPRLKEWAYAGAFATYAGAVASHIAVGDRLYDAQPLNAAVTGLLCLVSWALRPRSRHDLTS